jgi:hypothetical protein
MFFKVIQVFFFALEWFGMSFQKFLLAYWFGTKLEVFSSSAKWFGIEVRTFLSSSKWFGTKLRAFFSSAIWFRTEYRACLSSGEWFGTKLQNSECFSLPRNRIGLE